MQPLPLQSSLRSSKSGCTDLSKINIAFERLVCIKEYRTPQAFRAFARVYILLFGLMYGPYYIHLAKGDSEEEDNITLALAFACVVQLAISGLFTGAAFSALRKHSLWLEFFAQAPEMFAQQASTSHPARAVLRSDG